MLPTRRVMPFSDFFTPSLSTKDVIKELIDREVKKGRGTDRPPDLRSAVGAGDSDCAADGGQVSGGARYFAFDDAVRLAPVRA
jgi:hypothetical protein